MPVFSCLVSRYALALIALLVICASGAGAVENSPLPGPQDLTVKRLWYDTYDVDPMEWGTLGIPFSNLINDVAVFPDGGLAALLTVQQQRYGRIIWDTVRIVRIDDRGHVRWDRTYEATDDWYVNHDGEALAALPDGGLAVIGASSSNRHQFWVLRLDPAGGVMWRAWFDRDVDNSPRDIASLPDGGMLVGAQTGPENLDRIAAWIMRLGPDGRVRWDTVIDLAPRNYVLDVSALADGRSTIIVQVEGPRNEERPAELWAVRLDRDGRILWQRRFEYRPIPYSTADGGLITCPWSDDLDSTGGRSWLDRYDSAGRLLSRRRVHPPPSVSQEKLDDMFSSYCVALADGAVAFTTQVNHRGPDGFGTVREVWLGRIGEDGRMQSLRRLPMPGEYLTWGLKPGADGSAIIYGLKLSDDGPPVIGKGLRHHLWIYKIPPPKPAATGGPAGVR